MGSLFFYGTLRDVPLLELVLGRGADLDVQPARLPGYAVFWAKGECFPLCIAMPGESASGLLVDGLTQRDYARLDFYEGGFGYDRLPLTVETAEGQVKTTVYISQPGRWPVGAPWSLMDWQAQWGDISRRAAEEWLSQFGKTEPEEVARWFPQMRERASSWVRAQANPAPVAVRRGLSDSDVSVVERRRPYSRFFSVEEQDLSFRQFDGSHSEVVTRAAFVMGDAVTVLPYDPVRDRVLLVEQFRFGPLARGDTLPWSLEPIAGRIDTGETPQEAAVREAHEEAGLTLDRLETVARYYPSPGAVTEYLYSYVALADLPDSANGIGGLAHEAEDIRAIVLSFDALMQLLHSGEAENGPLLVSAYWLAANRDRLRRNA